MPAIELQKLWLAIDTLEAQEHIALIRALQYPQLKKSARIERDKKLYAAAYPKDIYRREAKDVSYLMSKLGGGRGR